MAIEFEFLRPDDKPALLAMNDPENLTAAQLVLAELGYVVHTVSTHEDFATRFSQVQYQVVIVEETFAGSPIGANFTLLNLQSMPMSHRRHSVLLLVGHDFQSLNSMQAFQQSVQGVVNPTDLASLGQIVQKVVSDNDLLMNVFRNAQRRLIEGQI